MGYIYLDRQIMSNWVYKDKPFNKGMAWIDLLLLAEHTTHTDMWRGQPTVFRRGDVNRSIRWLCDRWGWSRDKCRRFLRQLENDNMITISATTHRTTITVVNYDVFQDKRATDKTTNKTTDKSTDKTTNKTTDKAYLSNISNAKENKKKKDAPPVAPEGAPDAYGAPPPGWDEACEKQFQEDAPQNPGKTRQDWWDFWMADSEGGDDE